MKNKPQVPFDSTLLHWILIHEEPGSRTIRRDDLAQDIMWYPICRHARWLRDAGLLSCTIKTNAIYIRGVSLEGNLLCSQLEGQPKLTMAQVASLVEGIRVVSESEGTRYSM